MFKIDGPNATPEGDFQPANPSTGAPGTRVTSDWLNAVQNELINVVKAGGLIPTKYQDSQVLQAILQLIQLNADTDGGTGGGGALTPIPANANVLAENFKMYEANTAAGSFTLSLPDSPMAQVIGVLDAGNPSFGTNSIFVTPTGGKRLFNGAPGESLEIDVDGVSAIFYKSLNSDHWRMASTLLNSGGGEQVLRVVATKTIENLADSPTVTIVQEKRGKLVHIFVPEKLGLTKNSFTSRIGIEIDPPFRPTSGYRGIYSTRVSNGVDGLGFWQANASNGKIEIFVDPQYNGFTANSSNNGWYDLSFTYLTD